MISNVFLYKNLRFIRIFKPDLLQYWIKFALFTSCNLDFSPLIRCKVHRLVSMKDRHLSGATQACSRSPTNV